MDKPIKQITSHGNHFIDRSGRQVLLHGVNMVCKDKSRHYIGDWDQEDFSKLRKWGFNVIRLGVIWDALEPEPGVFNGWYIEEIRRLIQLAHQHDLNVFLDMHQDLYSSLFANGAPAWATITDGETYEPGETWSDAYLFNGAVQKAFDHFWKNTPASDGVGIQDHFAQAWGYLVEKVCNEPNVIGYDLLNEPFIGSPVQQVNEQIFNKYAELYCERYGDTERDTLLAGWIDPEKKQDALRILEELEAFKQVVDTAGSVVQPFEQSVLSEFYRKVASVIRQKDRQGILFLETNYFSNLGTESMIQPVTDANGKRDEFQSYAPHAYDLVVDTIQAHMANDRRLEFIFDRHEQTRKRLKMPMIIGEWGAFYNSDKTGHISIHIQHMIERLLCSDTYWDYTPQMDSNLSFMGLCRSYPMAVAGNLLQYRYEPSLKSFHMKWEEKKDIQAPTMIYLTDIRYVTSDRISLDLEKGTYTLRQIKGSNAGYLEIPSVTDGIRSLVIYGGA